MLKVVIILSLIFALAFLLTLLSFAVWVFLAPVAERDYCADNNQ